MAKRVARGAVVDGDVCYISLAGGRTAVLDAVDADLGQFNWCASVGGSGKVYAGRHGPRPARKGILLHRAIASRAGHNIDGLDVDHIDGDTLNNRRANLRPATRAQNIRNQAIHKNNRSGIRGVSWSSKMRQWHATIRVNYKKLHLGLFDRIEDAAAAYARAAAEHHGEFARTS